MKEIEEILMSLSPERTNGWGHRPIPNEIDDEVRELVQYLRAADPANRSDVFSIMTDQQGYVLLAFARRMAALAVRTGDSGYIREGLASLAFGSHLLDWRDAVLELGPLYHSLVELNVEPEHYFAETAGLGEGWFDENVRNFFNRTKKERSLKDFGFIESSDGDGLLYKSTW